MLTLRKANERGHADFGWLDSRHTFSFGEYHDAAHMGFGPLRVINDDRVAGGGGFPTHPHKDMEIITYVLEGGLAHKDSLGTGSVISPGDVQIMSAGTGIRHSEFNASKTDAVHFLQIWIMPDTAGIVPAYDQKRFEVADKRNRLRLIGSHDGREGSITIHHDADLYASVLDGGAVSHAFAPGRIGWLQVARGTVTVDGHALIEGDGVAIRDASSVRISGDDAEVLLFDMAE